MSDPLFGMAWLCLCQRDRVISTRLNTLFKTAGIPKVYSSFTFERFDRLVGKSDALEAARMFARGDLDIKPGLILYGPTGVGKSTLAACVARARLDRGQAVLWVDFNDFLAAVQDTYGSQGDVTARDLTIGAAHARFLIFDDMGDAERQRPISDDRRDITYSVLRHRRNEMLPTLITSNLTPEVMYQQFGARIADRVFECCHAVEVAGANLRFEG